MRAEVLRGQARPEGLGTIVYHGLLQGLILIGRTVPDVAREPSIINLPSIAPPSHDPQLIGLLANMLLQAHSEVRHVV